MGGKLRVVLFLALAHISTFISCETAPADRGNIIYSAVVFRSGETTPRTTYPTDPYKHYQWPNGYEQLTQRGLHQVDLLGQYLQDRYFNAAPGQCESNDGVNVYSGKYPPFETDLWKKLRSCQRLEILPEDSARNMASRLKENCPRYDKLTKIFYESSNYINLFCQKFNDLFEYVGNKAGTNLIPCNNMENMVKFSLIYETLMAEKQNNLTLPSWTDQLSLDQFTNVQAMIYLSQFHENDVAILKAGAILKIIASDILDRVGGVSKTKVHLFGATSSVIVMLLRSLHMYENQLPPPVSSLAFELRETTEKNGLTHYIHVMYKNLTETEPHSLEIPGCKSPCKLKKLRTVIAPFIPDNLAEECQKEVDIPTTITKSTIWQPTSHSPVIELDPLQL